MPRTHYLSDQDVHDKWDIDNVPLVTIDSGDTVHTQGWGWTGVAVLAEAASVSAARVPAGAAA